MNQEHLSILINGWQSSGNYLSNHFYRLFKNQSNTDTPPIEYLDHLKEVIKQLDHKMTEPYYTNLGLWNDKECSNIFLRGLYPIPKKYCITLDLESLTSGKCYGQITKADLGNIESSLNEGYQRIILELKESFTNEKLEILILELAKAGGRKSPIESLNRLLNKVDEIGDFHFTCDFYLDIHYLCKKHQSAFWSEGHKKDITIWLMKAKGLCATKIIEVGMLEDGKPDFITVDLFSTTWLVEDEKEHTINEKELQADIVIIDKNVIGYVWLGRKEDLEGLLNELIDSNYIDKDTLLKDFITIFSGKSVNNINQIKWLGSATLLLSFIRELMDRDLIKKQLRMDYLQLTACFIKVDGSKFNENFKVLNQSIKNELTPENKTMLALIERYL